MKKVMFVIPALGRGGGEAVVVSILENIDKSIIEPFLVVLYAETGTPNESRVRAAGVPILFLNKRKGFDISTVMKLRKIIKKFQPEIISTHLYTVVYTLLAAPRNIKKYHTVHNVADKEAFGIRRFVNYVAFKFGNFFPVAISPYCAKTIEDIYKIDKETIPCILNGVDTEKFFPCEHTHNDVRFISVGRLQPQKNQALLIRAFARAKEKQENITLKIVGEGELRPKLQELIKGLNMSESILLSGTSDKVSQELQSADVFVLSSDFEGLPVAVLEAMACGLPIITTRAGGVVDIVKQGENGEVVDIGDEQKLAEALLKMATSPVLRHRMGCRSREMARLCDVKDCAMQYQQLFLRR